MKYQILLLKCLHPNATEHIFLCQWNWGRHSVCCSVPHTCAVSAHFRTNRRSVWAQIKSRTSLWASMGLSAALMHSGRFLGSDWSGSSRACLDQPLVALCTNSVGRLTMRLSMSEWFLVTPMDLCHYLAFKLSSNFHAFAVKPIIRLKSSARAYCGTPRLD